MLVLSCPVLLQDYTNANTNKVDARRLPELMSSLDGEKPELRPGHNAPALLIGAGS
jgi:hypothetical protein